jgi:hypothetical protein
MSMVKIGGVPYLLDMEARQCMTRKIGWTWNGWR